jgi:diguanylate cyclase (GGDEF)-like protein/PAS domain S-box-containing protein
MQPQKHTQYSAIMIALLYLFFGVLWIYFSDSFVVSIATAENELKTFQTYKGLFYVASTAILLYFLVLRFLEVQYRDYIRHLQDITQQKTDEIERNRANALLKTIIDNIPDAIFAKDLEGKYLLFNHGAAEMTGKSENEAIGNSDEALFTAEGAKMIHEMDQVVLKEGLIKSQEEQITTLTGEEKIFLVTKGPIFNEDGALLGLFGISRDITQQKIDQDRIINEKERYDYLAHHDELTKLPNRLSLIEYMNKIIALNKKIAFMFLDLDGFKEINDSFGHQFGDKLLIKVTQLLTNAFPPDSYLVRTGGDEFVIIVSCQGERDHIELMMTHLADLLKNPFTIETKDVYVTASVGIAFYPDDAQTTEDLMQCADTAMYDAKNSGKNTFSLYHSKLTDNTVRRMSISTNLIKALSANELELYFQPQVNPNTNKVIATEALLRWFSPEGSISPAEFIPIAEDTGIIIDIGKFVLRESFNTAKKWADTGILVGRIAVNIAARQLVHNDFVALLEKMLDETQCNPKWIELEITERSILTNPEKVITILQALHSKGFHISIDDFGTGYSGMSTHFRTRTLIPF